MNLADAVDYEDLARKTDGFSGAQLESLATEAGMCAIRDERMEVTREDFRTALSRLEEESEDGIPGYTSYIQ